MRLRRVLSVVVTGAALYFAIFGGEYNVFEVKRLERQHRREAAALAALHDEVARMRLYADSLAEEPAALERIARERYGMIRDGERLYRFVHGADTPDTPEAGHGKR